MKPMQPAQSIAPAKVPNAFDEQCKYIMPMRSKKTQQSSLRTVVGRLSNKTFIKVTDAVEPDAYEPRGFDIDYFNWLVHTKYIITAQEDAY